MVRRAAHRAHVRRGPRPQVAAHGQRVARRSRAGPRAAGRRPRHLALRRWPGDGRQRTPALPSRRPRHALPRDPRSARAALGDRGRRRRLREDERAMKGFTLIEILVAVAILAVALAATTRAASVATDGALETRQRLLATWAAQNRVAEMRARRLFPAVATTRLTTEQGGLALVIDETVAETPNPVIRKVELAVAEAAHPDR